MKGGRAPRRKRQKGLRPPVDSKEKESDPDEENDTAEREEKIISETEMGGKTTPAKIIGKMAQAPNKEEQKKQEETQEQREKEKRVRQEEAQEKREQERETQTRREEQEARNLREQEQAEPYWEWLCSVPGLYRTHLEILLRCFPGPEAVWRAADRELEHLEKRGCGWVERIRKRREKLSPEETIHRNREKGIQFISHEHTGYPKALLPLRDRPYGLFYRGRLPEEEKRCVAVVGARMCTPAGRERAERLAAGIVQAGGQVVSGAAYGIDGAAQWEALERGGGSFAVVGCGADWCYPASHTLLFERLAREGGILSELPPGTRPCRIHFPMRNRIISGLSEAVAVVEAREKSGSLITADFAAEQGKQVFAVPGRPEDELSRGCNELIAHGAGIILSEDSFIREVFPDYKTERKQLSEDVPLAPAEKLVYSSLDLHSKSIWELGECSALSLADLSDSLLSLEAKGFIKETRHNHYARR